MRRLLSYIGMPILIGIIVGIAAIATMPDTRSQITMSLRNNWANLTSSTRSRPFSYADSVKLAAPAVVNIFTRKTVRENRHPLLDDPLFRHFFNNSDSPQRKRMESSLGSGVIINKEGYLLTNNHVIDGADQIVVLLRDGREASATLIGSDPETDLAVLKIPLSGLTAITLGEPKQALIGDIVLAIGNPFGIGQTVTQGIISATGRYGLGINTYENYLQTDAAINKGNSGGALIDAQGQLLGINTAILGSPDSAGTSVGIGFAIPADMAVRIMGEIIEFGRVVRGWLGIEAQSLNSRIIRAYNLETTNGVLVTAIVPLGPADIAGIDVGDVITHVNNKPIGDGRDGMNIIANSRPGETVNIRLLRKGKEFYLKTVVGTRPQAS